MNKSNFDGVLFLIAGIIFFIAGVMNNNFLHISLGCCFVALGISKRRKK